MSREGKIAWLNVGGLVCGIWALGSAAIMAFGMAVVLQDTQADAVGWVMTVGVVVVIILLPGFAAWKLFKASRRLAAQRRDEFAHKEAFR